MKTLVLAAACLTLFAAPAFAQDKPAPSAIDTAPTTPLQVIERGGQPQKSTTGSNVKPRVAHRKHTAATQPAVAKAATDAQAPAAAVAPAAAGK